MSVTVVVDSAAALPPELAGVHGIHVVPLHVLIDGSDLREGVDRFPDDFLNSDSLSTSGAAPQELRRVYGGALSANNGDGVVAVHISRKLSSTWDAGRQAADQIGVGVRVVDSTSAAMGIGFAALAAARAAERGADLDEVYDIAVAVGQRARGFVVVDRLDHLRRGGRISMATALLGSALAVKPVLHLSEGRLLPKEKARTASRAREKLLELAISEIDESGCAIAVHHVGEPDRARDIAARLQEHAGGDCEVVISDFGPTLGVHVGPGALGVVVVPGGARGVIHRA